MLFIRGRNSHIYDISSTFQIHGNSPCHRLMWRSGNDYDNQHSDPVQIKCGHYDTYQQSLSLRRCLPFWPFSVFRAISCFHSIIQHRFRERRAWPPTMRDSEPSSFGSGLSGLAMTAFSGKHELGEQWVVAMTAGPAYP